MDLWCWKQPLYQLSHNHCPPIKVLIFKCWLNWQKNCLELGPCTFIENIETFPNFLPMTQDSIVGIFQITLFPQMDGPRPNKSLNYWPSWLGRTDFINIFSMGLIPKVKAANAIDLSHHYDSSVDVWELLPRSFLGHRINFYFPLPLN